jgi:hypothetical protein
LAIIHFRFVKCIIANDLKGGVMNKFLMIFITAAAVLINYGAGDVVFSKDQEGGPTHGMVGQNVPKSGVPNKEYWCGQGSLYSGRIEEAKKEIGAILDKFPEKKNENPDKVELPDGVQQMQLNSSRTKLKQAEEDLSQLEEDAKRRGVPPGWIRCQF